MTDVIKRKGKKEGFDPDKIRKSIKKAFVDAGISIAKTKDLIEKITKETIKMTKDKTEVTSKAIKEKILAELDKAKKVASDAWRKFDKKYKAEEKEEEQ